MNLRDARREVHRLARLDDWGPGDGRKWDAASAGMVAAGWCPACEAAGVREGDGHRARLGRYTAPDHWNYGGRECLECEEFFPCGDQGTGLEPVYDDVSDADPGL